MGIDLNRFDKVVKNQPMRFICDTLICLRNGVLDAFFPKKCLKCRALLHGFSGILQESQSSQKLQGLQELQMLQASQRLQEPQSSSPSDTLEWQTLLKNVESYFCHHCLHGFSNNILQNMSKHKKSPPHQTRFYHQKPDGIRNVWAVSNYDGLIKESIHLLKYNGKTVLASPLGQLMFDLFVKKYHTGNNNNDKIDWIVPIPLYRWRMMKRGFNQAFLLVKDFRSSWCRLKGEEPSWQVNYQLLARKKNTKSQTGFTRERRQKNMAGAFMVKDCEKIRGSRILLVDDVHTTGATTLEAAKVLYAEGADVVDVLVLAKA